MGDETYLSGDPEPGWTGWLQGEPSDVCKGWSAASAGGCSEAISQSASNHAWAECPGLRKIKHKHWFSDWDFKLKFSALKTEMHQRSWWEIVIIVVKIANIRLHHAHHKETFSAKLKLGNLPMPKFFGLFSNRGFTTFLASCFLATEGAGATFFPLAFFPLGWKSGESFGQTLPLKHILIWSAKQKWPQLHFTTQHVAQTHIRSTTALKVLSTHLLTKLKSINT